jgi:hypothetical protein
VNPESPNMEILDQMHWSLEELDILRDCVEEKGVHSLGFCRLMDRRELVYLGLLCVLRSL